MNNSAKSQNPPITVSIPKIDLNDNQEAWSAIDRDQAVQAKRRESFSEDVYKNLPDLLKDPCNVLHEGSDKGVFLAGALGVVSGIMTNVQGRYQGDEVKPNLYVYVLGKYGTGKGALKLSRRVGEVIHERMKDQESQAKLAYSIECARHKKLLKEYEQGNLDEAPQEPVPPGVKKLFIPANNSSAAMKQILNENGGRGILFETEGDTLANTLKQDYGNYSDDLRKAFHHEPICFYRKTNKEDVEINSPCLSVVISSTYDQLLRLIPNVENGLFSRFYYYELEGDPRFKNPFDKRLNNHSQYFRELGERYLIVYEKLLALEGPIWFKLTEPQEHKFWDLFQNWKDEIRVFVSEDLEGTVNRLGLICFRICMVLSVLRVVEEDVIPRKIICTNQDFNNALQIVDVFRSHAIAVFKRLPKPTTAGSRALEKAEKDVKHIRQCIELHGKGESFGKIAIQVYGSETYKSHVFRIIQKHKNG